MRHIARLVVISFTVLRYGLDELALSSFRQRWVRLLVRVMTIRRAMCLITSAAPPKRAA